MKRDDETGRLGDGERVALAVLLFLRAGRPVPRRLEVAGQAWPMSRQETFEGFVGLFPQCLDKPCSKAPERMRAPFPMICQEVKS